MQKYIEVYTDGACSGNPGPAGAGVYIRYNGADKRIAKHLGPATNNIAELTAIKIALQQLKTKDIPVKIFTDSQYSIGVLTKNWKAKVNVELINEIKGIIAQFKDVHFLYVEGHNGHFGNEVANELAVFGSKNIESNTSQYPEPKMSDDVKPMICFHHTDQDGFCSAAVVAKRYPQCQKFYAISYNKMIPWELIYPDMKVIIVDFSFKPEDLERLFTITKDVIWIDHHKTAMEKTPLTPEELPGLRVDGKAACVLCWEYFFPGHPLPLAVQYVGDRDIWAFQYGDVTKNFYNGLESIEDVNKPESPFWQTLLESSDHVNYLIQKGQIIREAFDKEQKLFVKTAGYEIQFEGFKAIAINRYLNQDLVYDVFTDPFDIIIMYYYNGKSWYYTLRSKTIDVSEIAKKFGGGGHAGAAGFHHNAFLLGVPE